MWKRQPMDIGHRGGGVAMSSEVSTNAVFTQGSQLGGQLSRRAITKPHCALRLPSRSTEKDLIEPGHTKAGHRDGNTSCKRTDFIVLRGYDPDSSTSPSHRGEGTHTRIVVSDFGDLDTQRNSIRSCQNRRSDNLRDTGLLSVDAPECAEVADKPTNVIQLSSHGKEVPFALTNGDETFPFTCRTRWVAQSSTNEGVQSWAVG
ncbi:hypothetical protein EV363DRAFT_1414601 [Boletus edulis]|nr:hypothetical protein EV363DRAFT_1414601 [Boletus edulis]